ncbi:MAG: hypothetical protein HY390_07960 [Deltaproteobacteria bacterium]|nr:hypothetical protein [Deltaproteobacteria bacterium]
MRSFERRVFLKSTEWLKKLADAEISMEETGQIDVFGHLQEETITRDHTIQFLKDLRLKFQQAAEEFNQFRKNPRQTVKVYGIANTDADFLLFRNSLKLVIGFSNPGRIACSFHTLSGGVFNPHQKPVAQKKYGIPTPPDKNSQTLGDHLDIELGLFNEAHWTFKGQRVDPVAIVQFYFTEFVKNSAS